MAAAVPPTVLCLVTDRSIFDAGAAPPEPRLVDTVRKAVSGGVNMVQLRERGLPARDLVALAVELRRITEGRALLIINDRVDVAMAVDADGVQLGEQSMPVAAARRVCGGRLLIGRSVHDLYGAQDAERDGADFLIAGTIFSSRSHPGLSAAGAELISEIAQHVSTPLIGIGGITPINAESVIEAGADGVAVIGAVLDSSSPGTAARKLAAALGIEVARVVGGTKS